MPKVRGSTNVLSDYFKGPSRSEMHQKHRKLKMVSKFIPKGISVGDQNLPFLCASSITNEA